LDLKSGAAVGFWKVEGSEKVATPCRSLSSRRSWQSAQQWHKQCVSRSLENGVALSLYLFRSYANLKSLISLPKSKILREKPQEIDMKSSWLIFEWVLHPSGFSSSQRIIIVPFGWC
jgi:hypothetical protein